MPTSNYMSAIQDRGALDQESLDPWRPATQDHDALRHQSGESTISKRSPLGVRLLFLGLLAAVTACSSSTNKTVQSAGGAAGQAPGAAGSAAPGSNTLPFGGDSAQAGNDSAQAGNGPGQAGRNSAIAEAGAGGIASGGGAATAGSAGQADVPAAAVCTMPAQWNGAIAKPTPIISVGKQVVTNSTEATNAPLLVDGKYHVNSGMVFGPPDVSVTYASIRVGSGSTKLLLSWQDVGWEDYGPSTYSGTDYKSSTAPSGYLIKTSADSTDGSDGTWTTVATVTGNEARSRSHVVEFTNMVWVRFEVTATPLASTGAMRVARLDEIELHDLSAIGPNDYPDTWFILGDSITKMAFDRNRKAGELDKLIAAQRSGYSPALVEAGNGGETTVDLVRHFKIEDWLKYSEGLKFVTLAFGTNDSWCNCTPESKGFEDNLRAVIERLQADHRVPVLVRIPANGVASSVTPFNAVIDKLQREKQLPCGPDLYAWFASHPDQLSSDKVHPNDNGKNSINAQYAGALLPLYPAAP